MVLHSNYSKQSLFVKLILIKYEEHKNNIK